MSVQQERKTSRTIVALGSAMLLFAAAALGLYNTVSFETLLDRNMLHQCNGPQRGVKLEPNEIYSIAALPIGLFRLLYLTTPQDKRDFCRCDLTCAEGNANLYMTDYEGYWIYPEFLNDWQTEEEYDCISTERGNETETCRIRGSGDDWYCYIMVKARTEATNCTVSCDYA